MKDEALREAYQRVLDARRVGGREPCVAPEAMLALLRREGTEEHRLEALDHVMRCGACRSEFELLATLMASPRQVFSRLDLLDRVSGKAYEGYERTIDVHIRNLRAKIEPDPKRPEYVETVYGMGYRFAGRKPAPSAEPEGRSA